MHDGVLFNKQNGRSVVCNLNHNQPRLISRVIHNNSSYLYVNSIFQKFFSVNTNFFDWKKLVGFFFHILLLPTEFQIKNLKSMIKKPFITQKLKLEIKNAVSD